MSQLVQALDNLSNKTDYQVLMEQIAASHIIDLGVVTDIYDGRCTVQTFTVWQDDFLSIYDAEILYIGTNDCYLDNAVAGSLALVFIPASLIQDTRTGNPNVGPAMSIAGAKALIVSNGAGFNQLKFDTDGSVGLVTEGLMMKMMSSGFMFIDRTNDFQLNIDNNGNISFVNKLLQYSIKQDGSRCSLTFNADEKCAEYVKYNTDGSIVTKRCAFEAFDGNAQADPDSFTKWQFVSTHSSDGTVTSQWYDSEENVLRQVTVQPTGETEEQWYDSNGNVVKQVTSTADGAINIVTGSDDQNTITIDSNGISIVDLNGNELTMTSDGLTITAETITLDGNVKITGDTTMKNLTQSGTADLGG